MLAGAVAINGAEFLCRRCRLHAVALANEEWITQGVAETVQSVRQGRLGDFKPFGGGGQLRSSIRAAKTDSRFGLYSM